jgi:hypothetical protein
MYLRTNALAIFISLTLNFFSFHFLLPPDNALAHVPPAKRDAFRTDLSLVQEKTRLGVSAKRAQAVDAHWVRWEKFCLAHNIDPFLKNCDDPVPTIQVFAQRYRDGREAPLHKAVRSGTVEDAVRAVGQAFAQLGPQTSARMPLEPLTSEFRANSDAIERKMPPRPE